MPAPMLPSRVIGESSHTALPGDSSGLRDTDARLGKGRQLVEKAMQTILYLVLFLESTWFSQTGREGG